MNDGFADHSLLVPHHLQELYEMYMKEMDEKNLDRVVALDKFTIRTLKVHQTSIKMQSQYELILHNVAVHIIS